MWRIKFVLKLRKVPKYFEDNCRCHTLWNAFDIWINTDLTLQPSSNNLYISWEWSDKNKLIDARATCLKTGMIRCDTIILHENWTFSCRVTSPELSTWLTIEIFFENFLITVSNYHFIKNELHSYTRKNIFSCLLSVQTTCRPGRDEVAQCD